MFEDHDEDHRAFHAALLDQLVEQAVAIAFLTERVEALEADMAHLAEEDEVFESEDEDEDE